MLKTASPSIVEKAVMPTHSNPRKLSIKTAILALVPLILLLGVLTVKCFMDDTIRSPEDLEKLLDIAPLAVIPEGRIDDAAVPDDARSAPSREATSKNPVFANNTSQGTLVLQGFPK